MQSEQSWSEQRAFGTVHAMAALGDHPLRAQIEAAAAQIVPVHPNPPAAGFTPVQNPASTAFTVSLPGGGSVGLGVDATGAISSLTVGGATIADAGHVLGKLVYQTVNDTDVDAQHITVDNGLGCCCCYGWGSMQKVANPVSSRTPATLLALWSSQAGTALTAPATLLAQVTFSPVLNTAYGAPAEAWLNYTINADGSVGVEVQMFNKTSTRLGEAIYLDFSTPPVASTAWFAEVLGHYVDPLDVVIRGSQRQHGVGDSVVYVNTASGAGLSIDTLDAPVFSPWTAVNATSTMIVPFYPLQGPVLGFSAVLFSNIYNTNFPLYSVDDAWKLRFAVRVLPPSAERAARARAAQKREQ